MSAKPPTQVAGVVGIASTPITMNEPPQAIDWARLVTLPPFQMFAAERVRNADGADSQEHARGVIRDLHQAGLFEAYAQWHAAKGYWPGEDPYGRSL